MDETRQSLIALIAAGAWAAVFVGASGSATAIECLPGAADAVGASVSTAVSPAQAWRTLAGDRARSVCARLGLSPDQVSIEILNGGGSNVVYTVTSKDSSQGVHFPDATSIPAELRGKQVDDYVLKLALDGVRPAVADRDFSVLRAIRRLLRLEPNYEGIHVADTFIFNAAKDRPRLMVQKKVEGTGLFTAVDPFLNEAMGPGVHDFDDRRLLFAQVLEADLRGESLEQIFSAENLTSFRGRLLVPTLEGRAALRRAWTSDPDLARIRRLMKELFDLSRSRELKLANLRLNLSVDFLQNEMPWSTGRGRLPSANGVADSITGNASRRREAANGDFGYKNFFLKKDENGIWQLWLVDF